MSRIKGRTQAKYIREQRNVGKFWGLKNRKKKESGETATYLFPNIITFIE